MIKYIYNITLTVGLLVLGLTPAMAGSPVSPVLEPAPTAFYLGGCEMVQMTNSNAYYRADVSCDFSTPHQSVAQDNWTAPDVLIPDDDKI